MTIVDELKKLIVARGGQAIGIQTIAEACKVLSDIEGKIDNPLKDLEILGDFVATTEQLLGKELTDLQDGVTFNPYTGKITGTLKYVTGYTGFSGDPSEQSGHYLALKADVDGVSGITYSVKTYKESVLDSDQILIYRVDPHMYTPISITASKSGYTPVTQTYDLSDLALAPEEN